MSQKAPNHLFECPEPKDSQFDVIETIKYLLLKKLDSENLFPQKITWTDELIIEIVGY